MKQTTLKKYFNISLKNKFKLDIHCDTLNRQAIDLFNNKKYPDSLNLISQAISQSSHFHHIIHYQGALFFYELSLLTNIKDYLNKAIFLDHSLLKKIKHSFLIPNYDHFIILDQVFYKIFYNKKYMDNSLFEDIKIAYKDNIDIEIKKEDLEENYNLIYDYACLKLKLHKLEEALALFKNVLNLSPHHCNSFYFILKIEYYLNIINKDLLIEKYNNLIKLYEQIHNFYHEQASILFFNRAFIFSELGNNSLAYNDCINAYNLDKNENVKKLKELVINHL